MYSFFGEFQRFLIHKYSTFGDLHKAIQVACGWQDYHLYSFSHKNPAERYGPDDSVFAVSPHDEAENYDHELAYAHKLRLTWIFDDHSIGREIFYLYDYGDGWIHSVKMVGFQQLTEKFKRHLLAGARAFPLEDSGALPGYQRCVDAYHHPESAEQDLLEWMGDWNPEFFDLKKTQKKFQPKGKMKPKDSISSIEAMKDLAAFDKWAENHPATGTNVIDLRQKLRTKKSKG